MKNFKILFIGILFLYAGNLFAQQTGSGQVLDKNSQTALPGVGLQIKGTSWGSSTDFDGNFTLDQGSQGDILVCSYLGYKSTEVTFQGSKLLVLLEEDSAMLDEVMVVGYGTTRKKDLTGSAALVTEKDFVDGPTANASQLIQGKVAGVQISSGNGAPGSGQNIRIRGTGSLSLTSEPLIVVDGVPLADGGIGGSRNALNSINPNDIASMTVLKDASSTAIYGSRAANGVILITTKKGRLDQDLKVSFNSITGVSRVNNYLDVLDADEMRFYVNQVNPDAASRLGQANTNWQKEIYQNALNFDNNVSVSGSTKSMPYRLSVGYTNTEGVLKTDKFDRTTAKLTLNPSFLEDHLKVQVNATGSLVKNQFADNGAIGAAAGYDPTQSVLDANSKFGGFHFWEDPETGNKYNLAPTNPLALLNLQDNSSDVRRLISNAKLDYKLHFLPAVVATLNVGYDISDSDGSNVVSEFMPTSSPEFNGALNEYSAKNTNTLLDFYLNYTNENQDEHSLSAMAGYSYQKFSYENNSVNTENYKTLEPLVEQNDGSSNSVLMSFFGRANYSFKDKYLLTATVRADASSKLNPDNRWGIFPSVALGWNISNENFMMDSKVINNLKLRLGYGQVGNVNGLGDYKFLTRYNASINGASYQFGAPGSFYQTFRPEPINENLKWEVGSTINIGIDYSLFNSRVFGSLDVYQKNTEDLIISSTVDPFTNFGNRIESNVGDMVNKGVEFALNVVPVRSDNLEWTINANLSYNDNEVTRMPDVQNVGGISGGTGNTVQRHEEGYTPYSFYVYEQVYDENQRPLEGVYVDRNGDGQISDDDRYHYEDPFADFVIGLSTQVNYKNFDLSVATRTSLGNYVYNNVSSSYSYEARLTENQIISNVARDYTSAGFQNITETNLLSDYYVKEASFFKIDNITLGYTLPSKMIKGVDLRIFGAANNVLIVSEYEGIDPEIPGGIDNNFYPRPQVYSLGLNINF
jgi:iron complex outermembrane receptor protein